MEPVCTRGYILRKFPYSESSLILKVFTLENGAGTLMAKGAKRPRSGFRGSLETLCELEFVFSPPRTGDMGVLREASMVRDYPSIRSDLAKQSLAGLIAETYLRHLYGPQPSWELYTHLASSLDGLEGSRLPVGYYPLLLCEFLMFFCAACGFKPQFRSCVHCRQPLDAGKRWAMDLELGGPVCGNCRSDSPRCHRPCASGLYRWLESVAANGVYAGPRPQPLMRKAESLLLDFLRTHSHRQVELASYRFYREMTNGSK